MKLKECQQKEFEEFRNEIPPKKSSPPKSGESNDTSRKQSTNLFADEAKMAANAAEYKFCKRGYLKPSELVKLISLFRSGHYTAVGRGGPQKRNRVCQIFHAPFM